MRMSKMLKYAAIAALGVGFCLTTGEVSAQSYPNKPIRFLIPYAPGGSTTTLSRIYGQFIEGLGQPVIYDNRPGANGTIASEIAAKAAPDGYTILLGTISTMTINPALYKKIPYDPVKDFAPISIVARMPNILVVNPSVPAKTVKEFIALAKAKPGQLTFCSSGNGSTIHLSGELFKSMAGVDMTHIPYKGGTPAQTDLLGGRITAMFNNISDSIGNVKAGKLRALAVTGAKRSPVAPDVPTMAEAGLPGYEVSSWFGVFAPAGTPREIIQKLHGEIVKAANTQDVKDRLFNFGAEASTCTPEEFAAIIKADLVKWAKVVKESGASID